ncbi:hypothetical protein ABPG72_000027 [Tetrahymena utriculariae]
MEAIEKVTQQKGQLNSNQIKIDLDPLIKQKSDSLRLKISNMDKQSPKRSILYELSKFKDQNQDIIQLEKQQSDIPLKKRLELIDLQKKELSNQIFEDKVFQQGEISDELNYKSEIFYRQCIKKNSRLQL